MSTMRRVCVKTIRFLLCTGLKIWKYFSGRGEGRGDRIIDLGKMILL